MKTKQILIGTITLFVAVGLLSFKVITHAWNVNAKDAKITFDMPNGKHNGTVGGLTSTFEFDPASPEKAVIKAIVQVSELKADNEKLTEHLHSADFFDMANHPTIEFTAETVAKTDSGFVATGKLHMRDSIRTVAVPFKFIQDGKKATFKGTMDIFAGDFGIGKKSDKGNDRVLVTIEVPVSEE
ncbi:MAG TPA: YceI family protein [Bacteroidia bacterium]|nr:YceI family protein [Bacteroidia bacterium]